MSEKKGNKISFGLHAFKIIEFELNDDILEYDEDNSGYSVQFKLEANKKESAVSIVLKITAQEGENADKILARIVTRTTFHLSDIGNITDGNKIDIPDNLGVTLLSISLSTTRGAFAAKTEGHVLEDNLIPLIDPKMMYEDFIEQLKKNEK